MAIRLSIPTLLVADQQVQDTFEAPFAESPFATF